MRDLAGEQYGYAPNQVEMRLYADKFASGHNADVVSHLAAMNVRTVTLDEIVTALLSVAGRRTYTDDPVVMTVKALAAAGHLPTVGRVVPV